MRDAGRFRGPSEILLLTAVLVFVSSLAQYRTSAQGRGGASCPLIDVQTQKSIDAFKPIARFLTSEPRYVKGSRTEKQPDGNGMRLWTVTWDLWRTN